ncbi:MAG: hypothetical protein FWC83_00365 [Alphaproteobacteria bacterium]|nr:hypothetical protein [Alphaproteobacteria bacterium]
MPNKMSKYFVIMMFTVLLAACSKDDYEMRAKQEEYNQKRSRFFELSGKFIQNSNDFTTHHLPSLGVRPAVVLAGGGCHRIDFAGLEKIFWSNGQVFAPEEFNSFGLQGWYTGVQFRGEFFAIPNLRFELIGFPGGATVHGGMRWRYVEFRGFECEGRTMHPDVSRRIQDFMIWRNLVENNADWLHAIHAFEFACNMVNLYNEYFNIIKDMNRLRTEMGQVPNSGNQRTEDEIRRLGIKLECLCEIIDAQQKIFSAPTSVCTKLLTNNK